jgi:hypothetical protein
MDQASIQGKSQGRQPQCTRLRVRFSYNCSYDVESHNQRRSRRPAGLITQKEFCWTRREEHGLREMATPELGMQRVVTLVGEDLPNKFPFDRRAFAF